MKYLVLLLFCHNSFAWFCEEASSERVGSEIHACGIGIDKVESEARSKAFDDAKREFLKVCSLSSDCRSNKSEVTPMRTDCQEIDGAFKCYRMLSFTGVEIERGPSELLRKDSQSVIKKGLSKEEILTQLGSPELVFPVTQGGVMLYYRNKPFCYKETCSVVIREGLVDSIVDFKPENMEY